VNRKLLKSQRAWSSHPRLRSVVMTLKYHEEPPHELVIGDHKSRLTLPTG
jgi:hypothetical protein